MEATSSFSSSPVDGQLPTSLFFERYLELLAHVFEFLPRTELVNLALIGRSAARATKLLRSRIKHMEFKGNAFDEDKTHFEKTVGDIPRFASEVERLRPHSASLCSLVKPTFNLRRMDLIMCRISVTDFRSAMRMVGGTLQDLRIEMLCFREAPPRNQRVFEVAAPLGVVLAPAVGGEVALPVGQANNVLQALAPPGGAGGPNLQYVIVQHNALQPGNIMLAPLPPSLQNPEEIQSIEKPEEPIVMLALRRLDFSPPSSIAISGMSFPKLTRLSSYRKMLEDKCSNCGVARPSSKCGACKFYAFCTRECQMTNWNDKTLGHKRVCHQNAEGDSPRSVSELILEAAKSGNMKELDLAHYWHQNMLFDSNQGRSATSIGDDEDMEAAPPAGVTGGREGQPQQHYAVFSRPVAIKVLDNLVSLRLLRCGVDDHALEIIGKNSSKLKSLDISLNTKITDKGLMALAGVALTLEDLRLRQDYRLTDLGIRQALVNLPNLVKVDLRSGIRRLRPRNAQPANAQPMNARVVRITATTSCQTLLALDRACKHLKCIRIISVDDNGVVVTQIPETMRERVEQDLRGGIDVDDFGQSDEFYVSEPL